MPCVTTTSIKPSRARSGKHPEEGRSRYPGGAPAFLRLLSRLTGKGRDMTTEELLRDDLADPKVRDFYNYFARPKYRIERSDVHVALIKKAWDERRVARIMAEADVAPMVRMDLDQHVARHRYAVTSALEVLRTVR